MRHFKKNFRTDVSMLILLTNDDGFQSKGLHILAETLSQMAEVVVVAPDREQSASSHSISLTRPLRLNQIRKNLFTVDGTPTDCIVIGLEKAVSARPDIIVSGINSGPNLGEDIHYSGTVSAAFEGAILGIKSLAVSLAHHAEETLHFDTAAQFALRFCKKIIQETIPPGLLFNINVPNLPSDRSLDYAVTKQGKRNYGGIIIENKDPRGKKYYWIGGNQKDYYDIRDSDCNIIASQKIAITPLQVDMTDHSFIGELKKWKI